MKRLACFLFLTLTLSSTQLFGQQFTMDWYLGNWTTSIPNSIIPRFEIISESENTLLVRLFKDCETESCFWEAASSTPVSATDVELDPVKNADMLNGAFVSNNEKVFFDLTAMGDDMLLAEINIMTAAGPQSFVLEYERNASPGNLASANTQKPRGGSIYGTLTSEKNNCSDYTLVVFNPETGNNHLLKPEAGSCSYKIEGLKDGSYYYSVNVPEGSDEKSRFESDNTNNPLIILNGGTVKMNIAIKPISIFDTKSEMTSN